MKNQNQNESLIAEFLASGGQIQIVKSQKQPKRTWFAALRGRAARCAYARRDNANIRYNAHVNIDASFVTREGV